ncbi:hypothetical protein [Paenibacillus medicaginis]|uniref:PIN domain-containing protein n=1 Tax=Paenibacillus medicaginis TaxID=1470560 RepID=A0ABV5C6U8_9BACL
MNERNSGMRVFVDSNVLISAMHSENSVSSVIVAESADSVYLVESKKKRSLL